MSRIVTEFTKIKAEPCLSQSHSPEPHSPEPHSPEPHLSEPQLSEPQSSDPQSSEPQSPHSHPSQTNPSSKKKKRKKKKKNKKPKRKKTIGDIRVELNCNIDEFVTSINLKRSKGVPDRTRKQVPCQFKKASNYHSGEGIEIMNVDLDILTVKGLMQELVERCVELKEFHWRLLFDGDRIDTFHRQSKLLFDILFGADDYEFKEYMDDNDGWIIIELLCEQRGGRGGDSFCTEIGCIKN